MGGFRTPAHAQTRHCDRRHPETFTIAGLMMFEVGCPLSSIGHLRLNDPYGRHPALIGPEAVGLLSGDHPEEAVDQRAYVEWQGSRHDQLRLSGGDGRSPAESTVHRVPRR